MHTPAEAARHIVAAVRPLPPRRLPLRDALDRVLAEPVTSPLDLPPWDNSAMDGYAVRASDVANAGTALRVIETVAAGAFPTRAIGAGEATRIFTGAPLPSGADTVIRQEDADRAGDRVTIRDIRDRGHNVRRRGEDIIGGSTVLAAGTVLGPAQLGLLASITHAQPLVHPAPRVAFLGSGDEIADLDESDAIRAGKKIASSSSYTLHGLIRGTGAVPVDLGLARDTRESLAARFQAARGADVIVSTAGVSVGEHDLVRDVVTGLGGAIELWRVRMRPGAPLGFGTLFGVPWIGLPGNPVSTMVTFELFVRPLLRRLMGHAHPFRRTVTVRVAERVTLGPKLRHYLRVVVDGSPSTARLTGPQGSGILTSMARANALLIVPEDRPDVAAGELLDALFLDDPNHVAEPPF